MTICYVLGNLLYINLTNQCTNECKFCIRTKRRSLGKNGDLWIDKDPTKEEVIEDIKRFGPDKFDEVVFCGFGEPLLNLEEFLAAARFIKENYNVKIRVNTNGHANVFAKRDVTPLFEGLVDAVSISLNEKDAVLYNELCNCAYGEQGFDEMLDFANKCVQRGLDVTMSVVNIIPPEHIEECEKIATKTGAKFRVRTMIE